MDEAPRVYWIPAIPRNASENDFLYHCSNTIAYSNETYGDSQPCWKIKYGKWKEWKRDKTDEVKKQQQQDSQKIVKGNGRVEKQAYIEYADLNIYQIHCFCVRKKFSIPLYILSNIHNVFSFSLYVCLYIKCVCVELCLFFFCMKSTMQFGLFLLFSFNIFLLFCSGLFILIFTEFYFHIYS